MSAAMEPTSDAKSKTGVDDHLDRLMVRRCEIAHELTRPDESIFHSPVITSTAQHEGPISPEPSEYDTSRVKGTIVEQRVRYEFTLSLQRRVFDVEKQPSAAQDSQWVAERGALLKERGDYAAAQAFRLRATKLDGDSAERVG